jgi:hypothetical protein
MVVRWRAAVLFRVAALAFLPNRIDKLGGLSVLIAKLREAFGYADETKPIKEGTAAIWRRPDINRSATFGAAPAGAVLIVKDTSIDGMLQLRREKNANLGF